MARQSTGIRHAVLTVALSCALLIAGAAVSAPSGSGHIPARNDPGPEGSSEIIDKQYAWSAGGTQLMGWFGYSLAVAGDVNGDGYSDVIVGQHRSSWGEKNEGRAYLYLGGAGGLDSRNAATFEVDQRSAWFGYCVASAGDVNGDGYHDVAIGAPGFHKDYNFEGGVFLYLGSKSGLVPAPACSLLGGQYDARMGEAVATAGDVNGDGYDDLIVAAPRYDVSAGDEGRVYLYLGSAAGLSTTPAWEMNGPQQYGWLGKSVATAGDVNGDGFSDVIIGMPLYDGNSEKSGRAFLYLGSDSGLADTPDWISTVDSKGALFGDCVASAGDVNGDGYSDVIIGSPNYGMYAYLPRGRVYLYYGSAAGLSPEPVWSETTVTYAVQCGWAVSTAGDVNGDGFSEIMIGSLIGNFAVVYPGSPEGPQKNQRWYMTAVGSFGSALSTAGDVNGDGLSDVLVGAYENGEMGRAYVYYGNYKGSLLDRVPARYIFGDQPGSRFGSRVASAGDVNGDGCGDFIAGAYLGDGEREECGTVSLFEGSSGGFGTEPSLRISGECTGDWFGWACSYAGDANGDGYSDVIVGAPRHSNGQFDEGAAYLYAGSGDGLQAEPYWSNEGGQDGAQYGFAVARAGDVNGDGFGDVLVGAYRHDGRFTDAGRVYLYFGSAWGIASRADWIADGDQEGAWFGYALAPAGDLNGDGYGDVVIGAPRHDGTMTDNGTVFVYFGSAQGLPSRPDWSAAGDQAYAHFGSAVAGAGDMNSDDFGDIVVAAEHYICGADAMGRVYLYLGSPAGPPSWPDWTADGENRTSGFGASVGPAGDIDRDGFGDLFVGEPYYDIDGSAGGRLLIYTGGPRHPSGRPEWNSIEYAGACTGYSACTIRNVNGRRTNGLVIGAPTFLKLGEPVGALFVHAMGRASFDDFVPRQMHLSGRTPVDLGGISGSEDGFALQATGRISFGRTVIYLEWELKPCGVPFTGTGLGRTPPFDSGSPVPDAVYRADMRAMVAGLIAGEAYRWRVRLRNVSPFLPPRSAWVECPGSGGYGPHIRIGAIPPEPQAAPVSFTLYPNYPNPFNPGTTISYRLPAPAPVELVIYDALGRPVKTFPRAQQEAGLQSVFWNGRTDSGVPAASGVYFLRIDADGTVAGIKMVLIR